MIPSFSEANLEEVSNFLCDTSTGLTGSEIARYLRASGIEDVNPSMTKRIRLYEALPEKQRLDRCANNIAFGIGKKAYPVLAFNSLTTDSEKSEHNGLMNLMKGFFGTFRNNTAHAMPQGSHGK